MTFEEILKSKGFTDADLNDPTMKPIIEKFKPALEESWSAITSERDKFKSDFDAYRKEAEEVWTPNANARIAAAEQEAIKAREEAALWRERTKVAQDYGLFPEPDKPADGKPEPPKMEADKPFDPKAHKLVTYDDVAKFADMEGDVIAQAHDLAMEYEYLTGKSPYDYTIRTEDGRELRGMSAMRHEAKISRKALPQFVAEKFNFNGLRDQKAKEREAAKEAAIRKDEREKAVAELANQYGNPMMRTPAPSRTPFIPPKPADGKQPWQRTESERRNARQHLAVQQQLKQGVA